MEFEGIVAVLLLLVSCKVQGLPDIVVAKDGTGDFTKVMDAIGAIPDHRAQRTYIRIKEGIYIESVTIGKEKGEVMLIGDGMDKTIISGSKSNQKGFRTYDTPTVGIQAEGFVAQHMTFENVAGPYGGQAVALRSDGDRSAFFRCRFKGFQDTLYAKKNRQFYRECEIYGTVDFIFGNAKAIFQNCLIYVRQPVPGQTTTITAQGKSFIEEASGTVMQNCNISGSPTGQPTYLGRPWRPYATTVVMQSFIDSLVDPKGWLEWKGHGVDKVYYAEYRNRGPGAKTAGRVAWGTIINTSGEAAKYTVRNFIQGETWLPSTGIPYFLDLLYLPQLL